MRRLLSSTLILAATCLVNPVAATAQHKAGGVIVEYNNLDIALIADGWSVLSLLRGNVYNDLGDFIGYVHDAIVLPGGDTTFVIVNVAGFLNIGDKLVALPATAFEINPDGDLVLPNALKENLKKLPTFYYAKN
ncbi:MAG: PRC-barrel domain-containing protein [Parvibaculaceae bacterium]|nr:PRC-barrel domain-containing protein [Parvibaculaceae bacterium]